MRKPKVEKRIKKEKEALLKALAQTSGIIASACKAANISRPTFYSYCESDPEFQEKVDDIKEQQKDFAESLILKKMKEGDTTMIIFYAKTQMKDRGYCERHEITGKNGKSLLQTEEADLSTLSDEERQVLLKLGESVINKKE
jgi:hypothetical protein